MNVTSVIKEAISFTAAAILSCGPSQIYGLIRGAIDLYKYAIVRSKITEWQEIQKQFEGADLSKLKETKAFKKLEMHSVDKDADKILGHLKTKTIQRLFDLDQSRERTIQSLKKDLVALIPVVGAIFAWRIGAPAEENKPWLQSPFVKHAAAHALQDLGKLISKPLFFHCGVDRSDVYPIQKGRCSIPVPETGRSIDAVFLQGNRDPKGPTVVLTHGNGMICHEMEERGNFYIKQGFNVLMVTLGGYHGSPGVRSSEKVAYEDVEAVKKFLQEQGITQVGYHGLSLGGAQAFQGAVGETEAKKLKTMFVVAEQTFASTQKVFANIAPLGPIAEGAAMAAMPKMKMRLSKDLIIETDGFDNEAKARKMADKNIPLFVIKATEDSLMGRSWDGQRFKEDFADDLLKARYGKIVEENCLSVRGRHCSSFTWDCTAKLDIFLKNVRNQTITG